MLKSNVQPTTDKQRFGLINWFLPIFYILAQYPFAVSNVGTTLLIIAAIYEFIRYRKVKIHKWLTLFVVYCTTIQIIHTIYNVSTTSINNLMMPVLFLFIICVFINDVHEDNLYKAYSFVGLIVMMGMFYQSFGYYFASQPAVPITILPIKVDDLHYWGDLKGLRPSSFFTEPQAYASYMAPLLFLSLKRKRIIFSILISLSILLSTSSQGILLMVIIWTSFIVLQTKGLLTKLVFLVPLIGLTFLFFNSDIFAFSINKISSIDLENNIRLSRGFTIYATFDAWKMLFGLGAGNLLDYVYSHLGLFDWASGYLGGSKEQMVAYYTGVSGTLITYGFVAGLILFLMFYKMARYDDRSNLILLIVITTSFFAQNMLFNTWFLFYSLIYLGVCNKDAYNRNYLSVAT